VVDVAAFFVDAAPVGMARYAAYLAATGYAPADNTSYLREWPDWRASPPRYPRGNATVPVTGVSLGEARDFCTWAGGRLPTSLEWQAAAQAGDPTRISPGSGVSEAGSKGPRSGTGGVGVGVGAAKLHDADRLVDHGDGGDGGDGSIQTLYFPPAVHSGRTPAPADSETLRAAQNSLGLYDLVGNVWQYTDDEYQDAHTRFVLLRGGSRYQPRASSNFNNWYFGSGANKANHVASGGAVQFDRHAKAFLMGASYERAATVGFRCAYDVHAAAAATEPGAAPADLARPGAEQVAAGEQAAGESEAAASMMLSRQSTMEGSPLALAALAATLGVGLSLVLVGLFVAARAGRRAWRRRQAHITRDGTAAKERIFDGAFSQDSADSDDL